MLKKLYSTVIIVAAILATDASAWAQASNGYPGKQAVRLIVPYVVGGPVDSLARALGAKLSEKWDQSVVVENRAGANEIIGAQNLAKSKADGYTLMLATDPTLSLNQFLFKSLPYDPEKDLTPVSRVAISNMVLATPADFPANSLQEFVDYAKNNPGKISYGSSGLGNGTHLAMARFALDNNLKMEHVPYKGLAAVIQDMLGSRVHATVGAASVIAPYVTQKRLKALAISGKDRASVLPNVPTFTQAGFPDFEAKFYYALVAPAGVSDAIKSKIASDVHEIVNDPAFKKQYLDVFALEAVGDTPDEFAAFLEKDKKLASDLIERSGVKLD